MTPSLWVRVRIPVLVFLALFLVYGATISTRFVNTDVAANATTAWQIARTGQPWMDGLDLTEPGVVPHYAQGADGHMVATRTPGQIWLATPFYFGSDSQQPTTWGRAGLAAAFGAALAMALFFAALARELGDRGALAATGVLALTTPVWSVAADALWTHPVTVLGLAGATWAASRARWATTGLFFGIGMFARVHLAVVAAVVGMVVAWRRRDPLVALRVALTSGTCLAVLLIWNRYVFGVWSLRSGYGITTESLIGAGGVATAGSNVGVDYLENLAGFLVSPNRGLLLWTPLLMLLLPFVRRGWRASSDWVKALAVGGVIYTAVQLRINGFGGGDAFWGYRLALELVMCLAPLFAYTAREMSPMAKSVLPYAVGIQFAVIALGAVYAYPALLVPDEQQWTHSALLESLVYSPAVTGVSLVLLTGFGSLIALLISRTWTARARARVDA